jgi:copper transport protein
VLDGHQQTVQPTWLLVGGDLVHLFAGAVWFGGLVVLIAVMRRRTLDDDPVEAAGLVARFSSIALISVAAVTVGGVAMAVPLVGSFTALTSTTYGWLLVAKVAAVAVVVVIAAYNRQRLVPAITARVVPAGGSVDTQPPDTDDALLHRSRVAWDRLRTTVRVEAGIVAAVLLVTGVLVTTQPASDAAGLEGYYEVTGELADGLVVDVIVDPNRAGQNTLHLYVIDETLGRPSMEVEDLQLELTYVPEGIGPIPVEPFFAGTGHWTATIDDLAFPGQWEVQITAGIDRFTEERTTVTVPVAP